MDQDFDQLRRDYIEALRPVVAEAQRWWDAHCPYPHTEVRRADTMAPFHRRWVTGPAGHPLVLGVFREFYFRTHDLNDFFADEPPQSDVDAPQWGEDVPPPEARYRRPMDLLINDLSSIAPDLFIVMQGLAYVPVGKNPMDNEEC